MGKKQKTILLFCFIASIILGYLIYQNFFNKPKFYSEPPNFYENSQENINLFNNKISVHEIEKFINNKKQKKKFSNPFISKNDKILKKHLEQMMLPKLTAIFASNTGFCAILNDKIVYPGNKIDDYKIIKISKNYVILKKGKKNYRLMLKFK